MSNLQTVLNNDLLVNAGTIVVVAGIVASAAWKISAAVKELNNTLRRMDQTIQSKLDYDDVIHWVRLMRASNPDLEIPHFPEK
jgi:hypothetical protein